MLLPTVIIIAWSQDDVDEMGEAECYSEDQMYTEEDHYYYYEEEYEEEIEVESFEYEEVFEFDSQDYEDDILLHEDDDEDEQPAVIIGDDDVHIVTKGCQDDNEHCKRWASHGECDTNPTYMRHVCRQSCDTCQLRRGMVDVTSYAELIELHTANDSHDDNTIPYVPCDDKMRDQWCPRMALQGKCKSDSENMKEKCPRSCGFCQKMPYYVRGADLGVPQSLLVDSTTTRQDITWMIGKARNYIIHYAAFEEDPDVLSYCRNKHRLCAYWAVHGECETNEAYMKYECAPICNTCTWNDYHLRCPIDPDAKPAWEPGDLNKMFESIVLSDHDEEYDVEVLSSPETDGPWILTIDNLFTEAEANRLIELGQEIGYERSQQVGDVNTDGTVEGEISDDRTSTNAWCMQEENCVNDEVTIRVLGRIENLTGIPSDNGEFMQLLKYEPGQYYKTHHDFIDEQEYRVQGVRMLTVFLYLNEVEGGGATYFDELDLKVEPKVGRALIWPSTLDEDPDEIDPRTRHEAQQVTKGVKYAANVWYHQFSYKEADRTGCVE